MMKVDGQREVEATGQHSSSAGVQEERKGSEKREERKETGYTYSLAGLAR